MLRMMMATRSPFSTPWAWQLVRQRRDGAEEGLKADPLVLVDQEDLLAVSPAASATARSDGGGFFHTRVGTLPATNGAAPGNAPAAAAQGQLIGFKATDVYNGEIDTRGGTLSKLSLISRRRQDARSGYHAVRPHREPYVSGAHGSARWRFPEPYRHLHAAAEPAARSDG